MKIYLQDIFVRALFSTSRKVLSDAEIKVLEKGLDYVPIQNKINEPELRRDFENFCRQMRLKWFFRNEPTPSFSETPACKTKSSWNPPKGHSCLDLYLNQVEKLYKKRMDSNKKFGR